MGLKRKHRLRIGSTVTVKNFFMPKVISEWQHDLGQSTAVKRLKETCEWAKSFSDLSPTWNNHVMEFNTTIQGVRVSGKIEVTDRALKLEGKLPLIALPFKSWIPNILKNALKERPQQEQVTANNADPLVLYLHIPKAGGTTVGEFIYNHCRTDEESDEGLIKNGVFFTPDGFFQDGEAEQYAKYNSILLRPDLRAVTGHFSYGIHRYINRTFRYITVLREPVSRVISLYRYLKLEGSMSLEEFARSTQYQELNNDQTRRIAGGEPAIRPCTRKDLETAKQNLQNHFAVVGTTERIDETLALLKLSFGWDKKIASYPRNVNARSGSDPIPEAVINILQEKNRLDRELYDFADQLMNEKIAACGSEFANMLQQQKALNLG